MSNRKHLIMTLAANLMAFGVIGFFYRSLSHPADKKIPSVLLGKPARDFQVNWLQGQEHLGHAADARVFSLADFKGRPMILKTAIDYGVTGTPETFMIDRHGIMIHKESGPMTTQMLTEFADKQLQN